MAESSPSRFQWHDLEMTPYNGSRAFSITVPERDLDYDSALPSRLTTWVDCPKWLKQVERVPTSLQEYELSWHQSAGGGARIFFFNPPQTEGEIATPFNSYNEVHPSVYWPPVLINISALADADGNYNFKPYYKSGIDGPCSVLVEEFFSTVPHVIAFTESMMPLSYDDVLRPNGLAYDYSFGRLQLKECLRPEWFFNLATPEITIGVISYLSSQMSIPATNYTDWPSSVVISDEQRQVFGGYIRRKITAYAPTTAVIAP